MARRGRPGRPSSWPTGVIRPRRSGREGAAMAESDRPGLVRPRRRRSPVGGPTPPHLSCVKIRAAGPFNWISTLRSFSPPFTTPYEHPIGFPFDTRRTNLIPATEDSAHHLGERHNAAGQSAFDTPALPAGYPGSNIPDNSICVRPFIATHATHVFIGMPQPGKDNGDRPPFRGGTARRTTKGQGDCMARTRLGIAPPRRPHRTGAAGPAPHGQTPGGSPRRSPEGGGRARA